MPNHIITEVTIPNIDQATQERIIAAVRGPDREIDFDVLVPTPINVWIGSVGTRHETAFGESALDWSRREWGTKWNAYGLSEGGKYKSVLPGESSLVLTFQTAWSTPRKWLLALFNTFKIPFEYRWMDEGDDKAVLGRFFFDDREMDSPQWDEAVIGDEAERRRMHKLLWGVEEFEREES